MKCYVQYTFDLNYLEKMVSEKKEPVGLIVYDLYILEKEQINKIEENEYLFLYNSIEATQYNFDEYIFTQNANLNQKLLVEIIQNVLVNKKKVSCYKEIKDNEKIKYFLDNYKELFEYNYINNVISESFSKIKTPVIYICSEYDINAKSEVQLDLNKMFIKMGAKVANLAYNEWTDYCGYFHIPQELLNVKINNYERIINLKKLIEHIEQEMNPDVFIVNLPGGIMGFENQHLDYTFINNLIRIAPPDYIIMTLMCLDDYNIKDLITYVDKVLMKNIDVVIFSDESINLFKYDEEKIIDMIRLNKSITSPSYEKKSNILREDVQCYQINQGNWVENIFDDFCEKFSKKKSTNFEIIS